MGAQFGAEVIFAGTTSLDRKARAEQELRTPRADDRAAVRSSVDHRRPGNGGPRDSRAVPERDHGLRADGRRRADLRCQRGGQRDARRRSRHRRRAGGRGEDVTLARGRASGHARRTSSIADGLLALRPGDLTFAHVQAFVDEVVTVSDDEIAAAVKWLFHEASLVAEPSGAAAVAAGARGRIDRAGDVAARSCRAETSIRSVCRLYLAGSAFEIRNTSCRRNRPTDG